MVYSDIKINLTTKMLENIKIFVFFFIISFSNMLQAYDDRIIVIVNDKVILKSEVQNAIDNLSQEEIIKE